MSRHADDLHNHHAATKSPEIPGLDALAHEASPSRDLWPEIEARISGIDAEQRRSEAPPRGRNLLRTAAAVLLFVGGVAVGHRWGQSSAPSPDEWEVIPPAGSLPTKRVVRVSRTERMDAGYGAVMTAATPGADDTRLRRFPVVRCPEGIPAVGDLGIEMLLCVEGSCSIRLQSGRDAAQDFSAEPRIGGLAPGGPAAGVLRNGDALLAIDGVPVATREGGRRLANLIPGRPVTLRIRRSSQGDAQEMDVRLVPRPGCLLPRLAILADAVRGETPPGPQR